MLAVLKETKLRPKLTSNRIKTYHVPWKSSGVKLDDPDDARYLQSLLSDFEKTVQSTVDQALQRRTALQDDPISCESCALLL